MMKSYMSSSYAHITPQEIVISCGAPQLIRHGISATMKNIFFYFLSAFHFMSRKHSSTSARIAVFRLYTNRTHIDLQKIRYFLGSI